MAFAEASPEPDPAEALTDVYAPSKTTAADVEAEAKLREQVRNSPDMRQISYAQALVEAAREEMKRDESVFIMGEDVGLYGGAYGATRGLSKEFGDWRVLDTPISEATIGGAAVGRSHGRHAAHRRDHVRRFHAAGHGPDRQPGRQEPLHVRRQDRRPDGHPHRGRRGPGHRRASLAEPRSAVDALPRHLRRDAVYALRRQRPAEGRHPRRQPRNVHRAQDALRHQGPGARCFAGLHHPAGRRRHQAAGQGRHPGHLLADGVAVTGSRRIAGHRRDRRRGDRPA